MVDVTFIFVLLLGGPLAALVTALVRRHRGRRLALDLLAGLICGPLGTPAWVNLAGFLFARGPDDAPMSRELAFFLADVFWFSPVIGGFVGVGAVALAYRLAGAAPTRPRESWGEMLGAIIRIVGYVYAVIAVALTVGVIILAFAYEATGILSLRLFFDLLIGPIVVLVGWGLARVFNAPNAQPGSPPPR